MKHKRHKDETKISESSRRLHPAQLNGHQQHETILPPVTNFMDDWPELPSLPEDIDWLSLDCSSITACNNNSFRIIGNKSPEKCTVSMEVEYACIFPTTLHSVMLDGQYLHVLPWVDMTGYKRHFFPSCSDQELSDLTIMPEPW
ncbi:hypothetical protein MN116_008836 [Schistosoma mekongi]|uniref:Uncharacterized protein n=1 Tax=Schistosoma mekongi TaxID=38744 RepID=A0AAE1Z5A6_SCHME|nr:hypothetical protein MN116_008836 [Schistosoma mekongi]